MCFLLRNPAGGQALIGRAGERRGDGLIAMFHVTADTTWSNLPLSGLFVEMLRKVVNLAGTGTAAATQGDEVRVETLSPTRVLDGLGQFRSPPATSQPVARNFAGRATLLHPPGRRKNRLSPRGWRLHSSSSGTVCCSRAGYPVSRRFKAGWG